MFYAKLGFNSHWYHQLRLAPPNSSLHIPSGALITGDMDRIRAARPDYTRKSRKGKKSSGAKGLESGEGEGDVEGGKKPSQATARPPHRAGVTSEGDILNGPSGGDERRWWEKW